MTDHTPEPWAFYNGQPRQNQRGDMVKVCVVDKDDPTCVAYGQTLDEARANAVRIVACVNACAGIPTERLGDVKALVEAIQDIHKANPPRKANGYDDYKKFYFFVKGRARAALAPFRKD